MSIDEVTVDLESVQVLDRGFSIFAIRAESPAALKIFMLPYTSVAVTSRQHSDRHKEHDHRKRFSPIHLLPPVIYHQLNCFERTSHHHQTLLTAFPRTQPAFSCQTGLSFSSPSNPLSRG
jgi:hypothetical protein